MSGLFDQITNYSPPLLTAGQVNYKGTWDASANSPALTSPPAATTKGDYYVVSVAGTQFSITFAVGDWIISNGTAWEKVDLTDAVSSVFGRTGAVVGASTDYSSVGLTNTAIGASSPSTGAFTTVSATTPIAVASGGTGVSTSTGTTNVVLSNSPTIVTPVIAQINDASGNETLKLASIASAVNEVTIENAATGNAVHISATGGDASIGLHLAGKGASGYVNVQDSVDATKRIMFNAAGGTTATRTMLSSTQTVDRTISLPDATDTLVGRATTDTLTNKTLTSPTLTAPVLGTPASGTVTNLTGTASININGTVGATTASTGVFTNVRIGSATSDELLTINGSSAGFVSRITSSAASNPNGFYYNSTNAIGTGTAFRVDSQGVSLLTLNSTGLAVTGALSATGSITIPNNVALGLVASGGTQAGYRFDASRNSVIDSDGTISFRTGGATSFFTAGSFSATGVLTLNNNVGIGITPAARLHVSQSSDGFGGGLRLTNVTTPANYWDVVVGGDNGLYTGYNGAGVTVARSTGLAVTGALSCTGALSKGSGSFRIEHPLPEKSATHQLVHSFIEGPQADLIYRGKVVLVDGKASVNIDAVSTMTEGTFEVLCREVQCFTTNETGWTAVRGKVTGNILTIEAKDADCADEISWMVIGERQDPHMMETDWTDDNGKVIVEPLKPSIESN